MNRGPPGAHTSIPGASSTSILESLTLFPSTVHSEVLCATPTPAVTHPHLQCQQVLKHAHRGRGRWQREIGKGWEVKYQTGRSPGTPYPAQPVCRQSSDPNRLPPVIDIRQTPAATMAMRLKYEWRAETFSQGSYTQVCPALHRHQAGGSWVGWKEENPGCPGKMQGHFSGQDSPCSHTPDSRLAQSARSAENMKQTDLATCRGH